MNESRRALITGASGYIGSRLARRLTAEGWDLHLLLRSTSSVALLGDAATRMTLHRCAENSEALADLVAELRPQIVFHLASLFTVHHRPDQVGALIDSNVRFPALLLEAMARAGVRRLVNTGTAWQHYRQAKYNPVCLYAATKQAFDDVLRYYVEAEGIRTVTLQLTDTYGPGDPRPKLLGLLRRIAATGATLAMSPGEQIIDLVHVDDVIEAYLVAAGRLLPGDRPAGRPPAEVFAVRGPTPLRLHELAVRCEQVWGLPLNIDWGGRPYRMREVMRPWSGGETLPGWRPRVSLRRGLEQLAPTANK